MFENAIAEATATEHTANKESRDLSPFAQCWSAESLRVIFVLDRIVEARCGW